MKRIILILITLLFIVGCKTDKNENYNPKTANVIQLSEYQQIREGMTYEEVVSIIGDWGVEASSSSYSLYGKTYVIKLYQWINENGSNMVAYFENNILNSKAQAGLV